MNKKKISHRMREKRVMIDTFYDEDAARDPVKDLVFEAERYINKKNEMVEPGAFPFLQKLSEIGYIKSFRWLGDCYLFGIGCVQDPKNAECSYFEGVLFDKNEYCKAGYIKLRPELEDYKGDDLIKNLIKAMVFGDWWNSECARARIAELISDGVIKEYTAETAYTILKDQKWLDDGISDYYLGKYILTEGQEIEYPIVAEYILKDALDTLEYTIRDFSDEQAVATLDEFFHTEREYFDAFRQTKILLEDASDMKKKYEYDLLVKYGDIDEDYIYDEWCKKNPLFIRRS